MRSSWALLLPALASSVAAATSSPPAQVYLFDPGRKASTGQQNLVNPGTARLIFSHRLGLSRFESLQNVEDAVIDQLNAYAAQPQPLFGQSEKSTHEHGFIVVEGVKSPKDFLAKAKQRYASFQISDAPASASTLLSELVDHADTISRQSNSPWRQTYNAEQITEVFGSFLKAEEHWTLTETRGPITFLTLGDLPAIETKYGVKSNLYKEAQSRLQQAFDNLIQLAQHENFSLTVLFMPTLPVQHAKRAEDAWGSSGVQRSAIPQKQAPELIKADVTAAPAVSSSQSSAAQLFASDGPLRGPIPACFSSVDDCQSATRGCSGHGECVQKFKNDDGVCYGCVCKIPEIKTNPDGSKKTTWFGGPACNKKDISTPFWLFAGFTIFMMGIVSTGVGMLYSMGNEELPSVIGAGVSGPRAK